MHTIPFSSVSTVTNMTKVFSYFVADIGVAYREDTDAVFEICKKIVEEMRQEPKYRRSILEPLEVLGVDSFANSAVILKARIKTRPIKQWEVGREFNRRMKKRFDELGIEIPFPHVTLYFGEDKKGEAPAGRVRLSADESLKKRAPHRPRRRWRGSRGWRKERCYRLRPILGAARLAAPWLSSWCRWRSFPASSSREGP